MYRAARSAPLPPFEGADAKRAPGRAPFLRVPSGGGEEGTAACRDCPRNGIPVSRRIATVESKPDEVSTRIYRNLSRDGRCLHLDRVNRTAPRPRPFVPSQGPRNARLPRAGTLQRGRDPRDRRLARGAPADPQSARVIAPVRAVRRGPDDFLLLTEAEARRPARTGLELCQCFAAKAEIEADEHARRSCSASVPEARSRTTTTASRRGSLLDGDVTGETIDATEPSGCASRRDTPRFGREIDDRVLPAEAGLTDARSRSRRCYPGQEPIARQHHRGKLNCRLRVLDLSGAVAPDEEIRYGEKVVGRVTSVANGVALAYVASRFRRRGGRRRFRQGAATLDLPAPVAQGIEPAALRRQRSHVRIAGRTPRKVGASGALIFVALSLLRDAQCERREKPRCVARSQLRPLRESSPRTVA